MEYDTRKIIQYNWWNPYLQKEYYNYKMSIAGQKSLVNLFRFGDLNCNID